MPAASSKKLADAGWEQFKRADVEALKRSLRALENGLYPEARSLGSPLPNIL
jgi:hypothetical protein